jgi:hypothetical protein
MTHREPPPTPGLPRMQPGVSGGRNMAAIPPRNLASSAPASIEPA